MSRPGIEPEPLHGGGRRALWKRAIRTAYLIPIQNLHSTVVVHPYYTPSLAKQEAKFLARLFVTAAQSIELDISKFYINCATYEGAFDTLGR